MVLYYGIQNIFTMFYKKLGHLYKRVRIHKREDAVGKMKTLQNKKQQIVISKSLSVFLTVPGETLSA